MLEKYFYLFLIISYISSIESQSLTESERESNISTRDGIKPQNQNEQSTSFSEDYFYTSNPNDNESDELNEVLSNEGAEEVQDADQDEMKPAPRSGKTDLVNLNDDTLALNLEKDANYAHSENSEIESKENDSEDIKVNPRKLNPSQSFREMTDYLASENDKGGLENLNDNVINNGVSGINHDDSGNGLINDVQNHDLEQVPKDSQQAFGARTLRNKFDRTRSKSEPSSKTLMLSSLLNWGGWGNLWNKRYPKESRAPKAPRAPKGFGDEKGQGSVKPPKNINGLGVHKNVGIQASSGIQISTGKHELAGLSGSGNTGGYGFTREPSVFSKYDYTRRPGSVAASSGIQLPTGIQAPAATQELKGLGEYGFIWGPGNKGEYGYTSRPVYLGGPASLQPSEDIHRPTGTLFWNSPKGDIGKYGFSREPDVFDGYNYIRGPDRGTSSGVQLPTDFQESAAPQELKEIGEYGFTWGPGDKGEYGYVRVPAYLSESADLQTSNNIQRPTGSGDIREYGFTRTPDVISGYDSGSIGAPAPEFGGHGFISEPDSVSAPQGIQVPAAIQELAGYDYIREPDVLDGSASVYPSKGIQRPTGTDGSSGITGTNGSGLKTPNSPYISHDKNNDRPCTQGNNREMTVNGGVGIFRNPIDLSNKGIWGHLNKDASNSIAGLGSPDVLGTFKYGSHKGAEVPLFYTIFYPNLIGNYYGSRIPNSYIKYEYNPINNYVQSKYIPRNNILDYSKYGLPIVNNKYVNTNSFGSYRSPDSSYLFNSHSELGPCIFSNTDLRKYRQSKCILESRDLIDLFASNKNIGSTYSKDTITLIDQAELTKLLKLKVLNQVVEKWLCAIQNSLAKALAGLKKRYPFLRKDPNLNSDTQTSSRKKAQQKEIELEEKVLELAKTNTANRIVGGRQVTITKFPYTANYGLVCGSAIISPDWLITAAHCGDEYRYIYTGSTFISRAKKHEIEKHIIHPLYKKNTTAFEFDYDFQLLKLKSPLTFSDVQKPIRLGTQSDIVVGSSPVVTGWGSTYEDGPSSNHLMAVKIPVISPSDCKSKANGKYAQHISERMFCAGLEEGGKDTCQGDSGGPIVYNDRLIGVVSFGIGCAEPGMPGVYANVDKVKDWIDSETGVNTV